jgi:hypothetical protein
MRITILGATRREDLNAWLIQFKEEFTDEEKIDIPEWRSAPGKTVKLLAPLDTMEWRAAEYNLDPSDINTLIDILVCEQYVQQDFFQSGNSLFNAPDIETARAAYLSEIARIKLLYRVSTRGKEHPLNVIREKVEFNSGVMAVKAMETLLLRHDKGSQVLDPAVHTVLSRFRDNLRFEDGSAINGD